MKATLWIVIAMVLTMASTAEAARWKSGSRPPGTTYLERVGVRVSGSTIIGTGMCYYDTSDPSTYNQCRWKAWPDSCKWVAADSGTNQCDPAKYNASTLTATNGTVTFKSIDDRDGNSETMLGDVIAKYGKTGEVVTTRVHIRVPKDGSQPTMLSDTLLAVQTTALTVLNGDSAYPWTVERGYVWNNGVKVSAWGYRPQQEYFLLGQPSPTSPPPGGYSCGVSYQNYLGSQVNCFGGWVGTGIENALQSAALAALHAGAGCGWTAGTLASYGACVGKVAISELGYRLIENVYLGYAGGYPSYAQQACNAIAQARMNAYQYCQPFIPPGM